MQRVNLVKSSNSPYSSPMVVVPKPDWPLHVCINFRRVNLDIVKDAYHIHWIKDQLMPWEGKIVYHAGSSDEDNICCCCTLIQNKWLCFTHLVGCYNEKSSRWAWRTRAPSSSGWSTKSSRGSSRTAWQSKLTRFSAIVHQLNNISLILKMFSVVWRPPRCWWASLNLVFSKIQCFYWAIGYWHMVLNKPWKSIGYPLAVGTQERHEIKRRGEFKILSPLQS